MTINYINKMTRNSLNEKLNSKFCKIMTISTFPHRITCLASNTCSPSTKFNITKINIIEKTNNI